jgi:peptidoglycan/LPS O-acetylase OafA/YrhL
MKMADLLHNLLALWSVGLLLAAAATLAWFLYWFFLRRLLRARRIANLRFQRLMRERMEKTEKD